MTPNTDDRAPTPRIIMDATVSRPLLPACLLALLLGSSTAWASEPMSFVLQASGFEGGVVGDDQGRLIQPASGRPQRLVPGRWVAVDFENDRSFWFDGAGRVSRQTPYVEIRSPAFVRHAGDPDPRPVFSVWSRVGTALLHADGSTFIDWQPGQGAWATTPHPQRYSWRAHGAGERIFNARGDLVLALGEDEIRVAGPFADRAQYLVCDLSAEATCVLRDEKGATLKIGPVADLLPLGDGGWLAREGNVWSRLDAEGHPTGDRSRIYVSEWHGNRVRPDAGDMPSWPLWMTEYRIEQVDDQHFRVEEASMAGGLMQSTGRFVPVPGASAGEEVCPGRWKFAMTNGGARLGDADGSLGDSFTAYAWKTLDGLTDARVAVAEDSQETLVDCNGRRLLEAPPLDRLATQANGLVGTLVGEDSPRLWVDAQRDPHLLPEGTAIENVSRDGALIIVRTEANERRLHHVKHNRMVGVAFSTADHLVPGGAVVLRDGYYGFMDAEGNERLAPRYQAIRPWGEDRLWSTRYEDEGGSSRQRVSLHRLDGSVIASWIDVTVSDSPLLLELPDQGPVTVLISHIDATAHGSFLGQQWVDREGHARFQSVHCQARSGETDGAVIEQMNGPPHRRGRSCSIPAQVRSAMAPIR